MATLIEMRPGERAKVGEVRCAVRDAARLASMGMVAGARLEMIRNGRSGAVLVEVRRTFLALGRQVAREVRVEARVDGGAGEGGHGRN
ncbi:MAG: ferrous iron transport protein A [Desulfovibrionaceae bacterium]|jgi:Fe2+ transport system protein FeoA|nr:ferrous iron transport protein A [Desulfovibrionaceae bacterium]